MSHPITANGTRRSLNDITSEELGQLLLATRGSQSILFITDIVTLLRERKVNAELNADEKHRLQKAIGKARYGKKLPLGDGFPRGFQLAQLLSAAKRLMPEFDSKPTLADIDHMEDALRIFRRRSKGNLELPVMLEMAATLKVKLAA